MLSPHEGADVVSPHASLLARFRNRVAVATEEEESKYSFFSDTDDVKNLSKSALSRKGHSIVKEAVAFCCLWCAFSIVVLGTFGLYFAVDLALSHYGMGTGVVQWVMNRQQLPSSTLYGVSRLQY